MPYSSPRDATSRGLVVNTSAYMRYFQAVRESAAAALRAGKATVEYPGTNNPDLGALVHG